MVRGKQWTVDEEKKLRQLLEENKAIGFIAMDLNRTIDCVRMKIARLGLKDVVVQSEKCVRTTTTSAGKLELPVDLPTIEEELKVLVAALKGLETEGLDKAEVLRLRGIIAGVKIYEELVARFEHFSTMEADLIEYEKKYTDLAKKAKKS